MHLRSVETTPNPNSMKLNLHEELPLTATYTLENKSGCPDFVELLLQIDGVKSVFVCHDFITVNRDPRTDWQPILEKATAIFSPGELEAVKTSDSETAKVEDEIETHRNAFEKEGQVHVLVQTFRGVPIQVKTTDGQGESRVSLGERFNEAALSIQEATAADYLKERYWADHGVRYGERDEIAEEVADELRGTFDEEALGRVLAEALGNSEQASGNTRSLTDRLQSDDWHQRLAAIQQLPSDEQSIPLFARALQDSNPQVRRLAAAALGTTGSAAAVEPLCDAVLNDPMVGVRRTAGDALSDLGYAAAEQAMCRALSDQNKLVRWRAARFEFDVGTEYGLPFLERARADAEFEVRLEVEAAIQRIRGGGAGFGPAWKRIVEG